MLEPLRDLLATPDRWTQESYARTAMGLTTVPDSPYATCWCLAGAIQKIGLPGAEKALALAIDPNSIDYEITIFRWNDTPGRTHTQILELIDAASLSAP